MVSREHRRVRMRLPARLRWNTPFGQRIEFAETVDVSRSGLLLSGRESHAAGVPLWVTFPYDCSRKGGQPEVLARVVRCGELPAAMPAFALAIHFERPERTDFNGNHARRDPERRGGPRRRLAVPIRVRPEHIPWFEEAMSLDFSPRGMRFRSHREYADGELLRIALEDASSTSWPGVGEFRVKVVRVSPAGDGVALDVGVCGAT
ncbi:MAG TPA: PilZ domain-containing protein [Candidatus Dormibacteraeota bacterium]|nr:PilZ domain-containing protein [Candidatus Dormibacteraeota bacterium]